MTRPLTTALLMTTCLLLARPASSQDATCKALYDAARKASAQPGIERTVTMGDPAKPTMTMTARKTATGWYQRMNNTPWRAVATDLDAVERKALDAGAAFSSCQAGATEAVNGEAARVWTYTALVGSTPSTSRMWIGTVSGLPLKVQGGTTVQVSTYSATPLPKP